MTTIDVLLDLGANALAGQTDAGDEVYVPGDWPTHDGEYPVILLQAIREDRESLGRGQVQFNCVGTLRVLGRVQAPGAPGDGGGADAETLLWKLKRQIDKALINNDALTEHIQQYAFIRSQVGVSADGEYQFAELQMDFGLEYYQGPEDFDPTEETVIAGFDLKTPANDPDFPA